MPTREKRILYAVLFNVSLTILEIIGGFWTNSLAILSDALHDFGDVSLWEVRWYLNAKREKFQIK